MEAKELQIGDYFFVKRKNKIGVVREIDTIDCYIWCGETYGSVYSDRYKYDDIEPISLTPYILEKNGFELKNEDVSRKCLCGELGNKTSIVYIIRHKRFHFYHDGHKFLNLRIKYVHELQHALRLCGLNELADNFKV